MRGEGLQGRDRWLVPLSLAASVIANDGEEWLTMGDAPAVPEWLPVPQRLRRAPDRVHVRVAISVISLLYLAAVVDGVRSRGRGHLYQDVQYVFGLHAFGHLLASAARGGYTSGVLTAPTVVLPQWWFARRRLAASGVPETGRRWQAAALTVVALATAHGAGAVASALVRRQGLRASR